MERRTRYYRGRQAAPHTVTRPPVAAGVAWRADGSVRMAVQLPQSRVPALRRRVCSRPEPGTLGWVINLAVLRRVPRGQETMRCLYDR